MANHVIEEKVQLTGDAKVKKQFEQLDAAGSKAFDDLKKAQASLAKSSGLTGFVNQLNKDIASLQKQAKALGKTYGEVGKAAKSFATNVALISGAAIGAGTALFAFTKRAADIADSTDKAAQSAGLAIDEYGKLQFVFEQGNVGADQFGVAMKKLNQNIDQASKGTGAGAAIFKQLGVEVKNADGTLRSTGDILKDIADKFQKLPDGPRKSALAVQLFGKAGAAIVPILNDGGKEMQRLEDRAVSLGLVLDKTAGKIGDDFGDALNEVKRSVGGISTQVGLQLAPAFTDAFKTITDVLIANRTEILAFTQTIANQVGPAIKDIINALAGNDTAVVNKNFLQIRDTVVAIGQALGIVAGIVNGLFGVLTELVQPFVEIFNELFGTKFTAQAVVITGVVLTITGAFRLLGTGIKAVGATWSLLVKLFGSNAGIVALAITGILAVIATLQNAIHDVGVAFGDLGAFIASTFGGINLQAVIDAWNAIFTLGLKALIDLFTKFGVDVVSIFQGIVAPVEKVFSDIASSIKGIINGIVAGIQAAITAATTLGGLLGGGKSPSKGGAESGGTGGSFAGGGRVRGPGTTTSDSIPAWLSRDEWVIKAKAVRKYGSGFMAAVNGMRFKAPTFAHGGPVSGGAVSMPALGALAASGPTGRPFNLNIGGELFEGLLAPAAVAHKMVRFAQVKAVRSAGRRPSWSK